MMRWRGRLAAAILALLPAACITGPPVERPESHALTDTAETRLGVTVQPLIADRPGQSGIDLLGDPQHAFATLLGLAEAAERSLDLQYYAWHADTTGWLLWHAVWRAAERGVRVRLLIDDLHTVGTDWPLAALDAHPGIEVRLFNPFRFRYLRLFDLVVDFLASNRRMHNKSFIADNQAAVLGGRNIGDGYFGGDAEISFADLDVLLIGPVVEAVSDQFDRYWSHELAVPSTALIRPHRAPPPDYLATTFAERLASETSRRYRAALDPGRLAEPVAAGTLHWGRTTLLVDTPDKLLGRQPAGDERVIPQLLVAMGVPERRLDIATAYFVLSPAWRDVFVDWARRGVRLRVLTNSLAGIDVGLAHIGHARRRYALLAGGVEIWESNPAAARPPEAAPKDEAARWFTGSGAALHAKTAAIDGRRLFVGSLNLDQRSAYLNTEMGIVIENPELAEQLHAVFDDELAMHAFQVVLGADGRLVWLEHTPDGVIRHEREPGVGLWRSLTTGIGSLLPIDWLL